MSVRPPDTPNETLGPCPPWCDGIHEPREEWGISQYHETRPLMAELVVNDYLYEIAQAVIIQFPRASQPERRKAYIAMDLSMGGVEMDPEGVERLATALEEYLPKLRALAARLVRIRAEDIPDPVMSGDAD